ANHPILHGIRDGDIWVPTDVYEVRLPLPPSCRPLILGEVLQGMQPNDPPVPGKKNHPMLAVAWTNSYKTASGKSARTFTTTLASADGFENEGLRRLLVNATYWAVGLGDKIPARANVELVGKYHPHSFLDAEYTKGLRPEQLAR